jgi:hypothetical protein
MMTECLVYWHQKIIREGKAPIITPIFTYLLVIWPYNKKFLIIQLHIIDTDAMPWTRIGKLVLKWLQPITIEWNSFPNYTGWVIMFSVITNIYKNKTNLPTLMELFRATGKLKRYFNNEIFYVCTTGDTAHTDTIFVSMCSVSPVVHIEHLQMSKKSF